MTDGPWELPEGWRWAKLGAVTAQRRDTVSPSLQTNGVLNYVGLEHVEPGQCTEPRPNPTPASHIRSSCVLFQPGTVLYAKLRPYLNKVVLCSREGIGSTEWVPLACTSEVVPPYLAWCLRSPDFVRYATAHTTGSRMPRTSMRAFWSAPIPVPPISEQRRIVAKLDAIFERTREAKRLRQKALEDLEHLKRAALADAFPAPGSQLPQGWRWASIGDLAHFQNGYGFKPEDWSDSGLPIIRIQNLSGSSQTFNYYGGQLEERYRVRNGDILVSWSATLDVFVWRHGDAWLNQHIFKVWDISGGVTERYIFFALKTAIEAIRQKTHGTTMRHVTKGPFLSTRVPVPPVSEQRRIVEELDALLAQTHEAELLAQKAVEDLERLEQSVLDRAFRGEL